MKDIRSVVSSSLRIPKACGPEGSVRRRDASCPRLLSFQEFWSCSSLSFCVLLFGIQRQRTQNEEEMAAPSKNSCNNICSIFSSMTDLCSLSSIGSVIKEKEMEQALGSFHLWDLGRAQDHFSKTKRARHDPKEQSFRNS